MKSLFLSQRMAGLPSGLSEKDLNVQVSILNNIVIFHMLSRLKLTRSQTCLFLSIGHPKSNSNRIEEVDHELPVTNLYLTELEGRTVDYGPRFRAWAINRRGKTRVRNLQY